MKEGHSRLTEPVFVTLPELLTSTSGPSQVQSKYAFLTILATEAWIFRLVDGVVVDERNEVIERGTVKKVDEGH